MTRHLILVPLLITLTFNSVFGQTIDKLDDELLIRVFNGLTTLAEKRTDELAIRVFEIGNEPGSAGQPSGEITHTIYIAVSEYDEYPAQNVFVFGPVYGPKASFSTTRDDGPELIIEYGSHDSRQTATFKISLDKIELKK